MKRRKLKKPRKRERVKSASSASQVITRRGTATPAGPARPTYPIFDSLSRMTPQRETGSGHSTSRSVPVRDRPARQLARRRDNHSDPNVRALSPLQSRRGAPSSSSQNPVRSTRSTRDAPRTTHPASDHNRPLRTIVSSEALGSGPRPSTSTNCNLSRRGSNPPQSMPRELSLTNSRSLSYSTNREEASPIPPLPLPSCSPQGPVSVNPNTLSSTGLDTNLSPFSQTTPPTPQSANGDRSPPQRFANKLTPSPPADQVLNHQLAQSPGHHQQQHSDSMSVSVPSPQVEPPVQSQLETARKRKSQQSLPQQIIIIHKKKKRSPSPSPESVEKKNRALGPNNSLNPRPPSTGSKTVGSGTPSVPVPSNVVVKAWSSEEDAPDSSPSSGGSTPLLSDGDTSSIEIVVQPIQPKHGIIFEDEQHAQSAQGDISLTAKQTKYDRNLDFAANNGQSTSSKVSESEDAEFDALD